MSLQRSSLIGSPGKITFNGGEFVSKENIALDVDMRTEPLADTLHGKIDEVVTDVVGRLRFTPAGRWQDLAVLFPYLNPTIGDRIFGNADVPAVVLATNGDKYTLKACAVTKMPDIFLGVDKTAFGECEITAVRANNTDPDDADSLLLIETAQIYAAPAFDPADLVFGPYSAAWGAVAGFTAFEAKEGWTIQSELQLEPVTVNSIGTVDMKLTGIEVVARCIPVGPTAAQIVAAHKFQGAALGRRLGAAAADLVITGPGATITVKNAQLKTSGYVFGDKPLRNGEVAFVSTVGFTAGARVASMTLA